MCNRYGLDTDYFKKKLKLLLRDIDDYTPDEMARELARMSKTASSDVLNEPEFNFKRIDFKGVGDNDGFLR